MDDVKLTPEEIEGLKAIAVKAGILTEEGELTEYYKGKHEDDGFISRCSCEEDFLDEIIEERTEQNPNEEVAEKLLPEEDGCVVASSCLGCKFEGRCAIGEYPDEAYIQEELSTVSQEVIDSWHKKAIKSGEGIYSPFAKKEPVVPKSTFCNFCGLSLIPDHSGMGELSGLIDAKVAGGYDSTPGNGCGALDDMTAYKFSLCEFCLDWLFAQFKIPPTVYDQMNYTEEEWRPAHQRVVEDDWRHMKKEFFDEEERREEARE